MWASVQELNAPPFVRNMLPKRKQTQHASKPAAPPPPPGHPT